MKTQLSLFWAASVLARIAAAKGNGSGTTQGAAGSSTVTATNVSVADFKNDFATAQIVPEVLAAFNPSVAFYAGYNTDGGARALLTPGLALTKSGKITRPAHILTELTGL